MNPNAVSAADSPRAAAEPENDMSPQDFVISAILAGMADAQLSRLALGKSSNQDVLQFAQRMVEHNGNANLELAGTAIKAGLYVPGAPDAVHMSLIREMDRLAGPEFDRAYMRHMSESQSSAVALFTYGAWISDRSLAEFARHTLPAVRQHKVMTSRITSRLNGARI